MVKRNELDVLMQKINARRAMVGIIGLGYVGLPLVEVFHGAGFPVTGFDIDQKKVNMLRSGKSYIKHVSSKIIRNLSKSLRFRVTADNFIFIL